MIISYVVIVILCLCLYGYGIINICLCLYEIYKIEHIEDKNKKK